MRQPGRQPFTGPTIAAIAEQHLCAEVPPVGEGEPRLERLARWYIDVIGFQEVGRVDAAGREGLHGLLVEQFQGFLWGMLWIFLMTGINNAATFRHRRQQALAGRLSGAAHQQRMGQGHSGEKR